MTVLRRSTIVLGLIVVAHGVCYGFAVGERPASQLWCAQDQSSTFEPIESDSVEQAIKERILDMDDLPTAVVICARYEDPRDLRPNDNWQRRMVAELIFEVNSQEDDNTSEGNESNMGGYVRLYKEVSPPGRQSWRFDDTFAVRWQPSVSGSAQEAMDYVILEYIGGPPSDVRVFARSVFGARREAFASMFCWIGGVDYPFCC